MSDEGGSTASCALRALTRILEISDLLSDFYLIRDVNLRRIGEWELSIACIVALLSTSGIQSALDECIKNIYRQETIAPLIG